ncbi:MAG: ribonuclease P protein component [Candidatus Omnitrophota bacterium]
MKIRHIVKKHDFTAVFEGKKTVGNFFALYTRRDVKDEDVFSVGVVVAKKSAPKAVARNYIRRRIYAYFRDKKMFLKGGSSVIFRLRKDIRGVKRKELGRIIPEELSALSMKAKI